MNILINKSLVKSLIPERFIDSHKGSYGKAAIICGSEEMPGASRLVSKGAYIVGAGLVRSYAGESFAPYLKNDIPEVIVRTVKEGFFKTFSENLYAEVGKEIQEYDVVAFGCGVGRNIELEKTVSDLIINNRKILIIDGDGISLLKNNLGILQRNKGKIILTPHPKELSRITGLSIEYILNNKEKVVNDFSIEHNVFLLLKGNTTMIASPEGKVYLNNTGNSSLSKAGTGDVLTGFIAGFIAQGSNPLNALIISAYLHGKCGELASETLSEYSVMASDLIDYLPKLLNALQGDEDFA